RGTAPPRTSAAGPSFVRGPGPAGAHRPEPVVPRRGGAHVRVAVFSSKPYDQQSLAAANLGHGHELAFLEPRLTPETAPLAHGFPAVCAFVNDQLSAPVLRALAAGGTRLVALRSAGFNHVDVPAAAELGLTVARVPAYSPHAVAEHAVGLILALDRKIHRAYNRVREGNFSLDGLLGFDLHGRTVGTVGTGKIGEGFARIMAGFGCRLLAHDPFPRPEVEALGVRYVPLDELFAESDVVALHCPLTPETHHVVDAGALARMKDGVMLVNTGRGALVDTRAVIAALKSGKIGSLGLDVYEEEAGLFFEDHSQHVIADDVFARLLTFPNVLVTAHQGFFTVEALRGIAETTLANVAAFERGAVEEMDGLVTAPGR
ncbi:MAG TPA: 2-hydroxyacid dehydrogenase, partial [Longimicrobiaceae bacterium]|nr:2-hydroxyacid dehydrogenase [Longimicrobiaceae bacterium]